MSRIVALFHRDRRTVDREILARLVAPLRNRATDGPRLWVNAATGLAYQCLQTSGGPDELQPCEGGAGLALCFDGRLDNREELIPALSIEGGPDPASLPDTSIVLACYRRFGNAFAARLNGDFALALFDKERQQLVLARDVIGVRPLYYWMSGDMFIAASEIKALLAHPRVDAQPDDDGLADLLGGGNPPDLHLTLFQNVRRVLPGHTVIVTPERLEEFQHWDFDPARQIRYGSIDEYAEEFRGLFAQAVRRRLRKSNAVAVTVSGGLDSSAILCQAEALRKAGEPVPGVHGISRLFPDGSPADEKQYLEAIEAQFGVGIHRVPASPITTSGDRDWPWRIECPELPGSNDLDCLEAARDLACSVVLDGQYGDQILWSGAPFFDSLRSFRWLEAHGRFRALCRSMTDCVPRVLLKEVLLELAHDAAPDRLLVAWRTIRRWLGRERTPAWYSRAIRDLVYRRSQLRRRPSGPFANRHARLCYGTMRGAHLTVRLEILNKIAAYHGLERAHPFLDRDLAAFIMAIPGETVLWNGVYKGLFREAMRGVLPEAIRSRNWKADFTQLECDSAAALISTSRGGNLGPQAMAVKRGYIEPASVSSALARTLTMSNGPSFLTSRQLNELVSFEIWLQAYFAGGIPGLARKL